MKTNTCSGIRCKHACSAPNLMNFENTRFDLRNWGLNLERGAMFLIFFCLQLGYHLYFPIALLRIAIPFWASSMEPVKDSRARPGLWKPSEFSAVQNSQRMWAFRCWF